MHTMVAPERQKLLKLSNTLVIANLIHNASLSIEPHCQLLSLLAHWSYQKKKKLPKQCPISVKVYAKEACKPSLHIIALTGGSVGYSSYHSSSFFKLLWFNPFNFSLIHLKSLDYCKIVEEYFDSLRHFGEALLKTLMVLPKPGVKHSLKFSHFSPFTSVH